MTIDHTLTARDLLRHEPFVRSVARALVRDEHAVDDLVQDTWLRALRRPPQGLRSARAWLGSITRNLARDRGRDDARRDERERDRAFDATDARATESAAASFERLAAQRELVDAVLALDEPYRSVVLLRYAEDLSTAAIAERTGRSEATVRSQLSRAHAQLRERLDHSFDGGRAAWAVLLVPGLSPERVGAGVGSAWGTGAVVVGAVGAAGLALSTLDPFGASPRTQAPAIEYTVGAMAPALGTPEARLLLAQDDEAGDRDGRTTVAPTESVADRVALEALGLHELRELAQLTLRELSDRVLAPDPELLAAYAPFLAATDGIDGGAFKVLDRTSGSTLTTIRGGGSYFSFHTRSHSYDHVPSVSVQGRTLDSGFAGYDFGIVIDLGPRDIAACLDLDQRHPAWLDEIDARAWEMAWREISLEDAVHGSDFKTELREVERERRSARRTTKLVVGHSYLVRSTQIDDEDRVVVVQCVATDTSSSTFLWQVLNERAPIRDGRDPRPREVAAGPPNGVEPPIWLKEGTESELRDLLGRIRSTARPLLFDISEAARVRFAAAIKGAPASFASNSGYGRILHRGEWDALVDEPDLGAYWSFLERSNSLQDTPELGLEQGRLSAGFPGPQRSGLILDLGILPFDDLPTLYSGRLPTATDAATAEAFEFMRTVRGGMRSEGAYERPLDEWAANRIDELRLAEPATARLGHSFALRSLLYDDHDHLVVFTLIEENEAGFGFAWSIVKTWPVPR